jgi:hypothetical protein
VNEEDEGEGIWLINFIHLIGIVTLNPPNLYNEYILTIKCMIVKTILYPGK